MTSLLTNIAAMNALQSLRGVTQSLEEVQGRIATGLKITSGKDNAAYYQISETMKGDSAAYASINEGLTLTKNSVATARLGAENFQGLAQQFQERVAFAQGAKGGYVQIGQELDELLKQMETTIKQSTFNGDDMVNATGAAAAPVSTVSATTGAITAATPTVADRNVVTGITRAGGVFAVTTIKVSTLDLSSILSDFKGIANAFATRAGDATSGEDYLKGVLASTESTLGLSTKAATIMGLSEKALEGQQEFLNELVDNIDAGVGSMIDANMEEEAARLQALQTQQQLATQALSIANAAPSNVMSLFK